MIFDDKMSIFLKTDEHNLILVTESASTDTVDALFVTVCEYVCLSQPLSPIILVKLSPKVATRYPPNQPAPG